MLYKTTVTGYRFKTRLLDAEADYIPSLIGVDPRAPSNPTMSAYFEAVDEPYHLLKIGEIITTKWCVEGSNGRNRILQCRYERGTFYIPTHELLAEAEKDENGKALIGRIVNLTASTLNMGSR